MTSVVRCIVSNVHWCKTNGKQYNHSKRHRGKRLKKRRRNRCFNGYWLSFSCRHIDLRHPPCCKMWFRYRPVFGLQRAIYKRLDSHLPIQSICSWFKSYRLTYSGIVNLSGYRCGGSGGIYRNIDFSTLIQPHFPIIPLKGHLYWTRNDTLFVRPIQLEK